MEITRARTDRGATNQPTINRSGVSSRYLGLHTATKYITATTAASHTLRVHPITIETEITATAAIAGHRYRGGRLSRSTDNNSDKTVICTAPNVIQWLIKPVTRSPT